MEAYEDLNERWGAIADIGGVEELIGWDERTKMPGAGAEARAEAHATLARLRHELLIDDGLWEVLERLAPGGADAPEPGTLEADTVAIAHRTVARARQVPSSLSAEMARAASRGETAWERARDASDLGSYLPHLERNIELAREYAACFPDAEQPYDALLDLWEPGMKTEDVKRILGELRAGLVPIVAAIAENPDAVDDSLLSGSFDGVSQRRAVHELVELLPLDEDTWRLDETVHPFMASPGSGDIRLTTRFIEGDISFSLFSSLHEAGHGIYEAGVPADLRRTPIGQLQSLSFHESQSRMWENWVGRSRPYLASALPVLQRELGGAFGAASAEDLYRASNKSAPSLVRVEADEVTYNLHIALRFELELELIDGTLAPADLADAWAERTR